MRLAFIVALAFTAAHGQTNNLSLSNAHATYGLLGPVREDVRVLPGDTLSLEFDIEGITIAPDGKVLYAIGLEAVDARDKVIYRQNPTDLQALASLGGKSVPAQAYLDIGLDQPAGDLALRVTVTDRVSKQTRAFTQKVQILPADFGIVQLKVTSDPEGMVPAGLVAVGDSIWANFAVVKFGRDSTSQQPKLQFEMRILDDKGKPTLDKPEAGVIDRDVAAGAKLLGGQFGISANRAGKFTVELKAIDKVADKSAVTSFPLTVHSRASHESQP